MGQEVGQEVLCVRVPGRQTVVWGEVVELRRRQGWSLVKATVEAPIACSLHSVSGAFASPFGVALLLV